jgi:hypothetical protein
VFGRSFHLNPRFPVIKGYYIKAVETRRTKRKQIET